MKVNKFFAMMACAAMFSFTFVACDPEKENNPDQPNNGDNTEVVTPGDETLTITPTTLTMKIGEEATITANQTVTWTLVSDKGAVTLSTTEGESTVVTAVVSGGATVIASVGAQQEFCVIDVQAEEEEEVNNIIQASEIYPLQLDGQTFEKNKDKVVYDFRPNDDTHVIDIWSSGETYAAGTTDGMNYYNIIDEGYVSFVVTTYNWSGGGLNLKSAEDAEHMNALIAKIIESPDDYYFHIGMKSTDNATHWFYLFGATPACDIVIGPTDFNDNGTIHPAKYDYKRNGAWQSIDVPLSSMASALANVSVPAAGGYIMSFLSGGVAGTQLNYDACYIYKK